jgi:hypothetical protein
MVIVINSVLASKNIATGLAFYKDFQTHSIQLSQLYDGS